MFTQKRSKAFFPWFLLLILSSAVVACNLGQSVAEKAIESIDDEGIIATAQAGLEQFEAGATAAAAAADVTPDTGSGTSLENPIQLVDGQPVSGLLTLNNVQYYYRITLSPSALLTVTAENPADSTGDYSIGVFSTGGGFSGGSAPLNVPVGQRKQMRFITSEDGGGAFILSVTGGLFGDTAYNFSYDIGMQDDAGIGGDALSDTQVVSGSPIGGAGVYTGILGDQDLGDTFQFTAPAYSTVLITVRNSPESETSLYAQPSVDSEPLLRSATSLDMRQTIGPGNGYTFADSNTKESRYVVYIGGQQGAVVRGQYELEIVIAAQDDAGSGGDAGDTIAEATAVTLGNTLNAFLAPGDEDCFRFASTAGSQVTVEVSSTPDEFFGNTLGFRLVNANNDTLGTTGSVAVGQSKTMAADGTGDEMVFCATGGGRSAPYTFTVNP